MRLEAGDMRHENERGALSATCELVCNTVRIVLALFCAGGVLIVKIRSPKPVQPDVFVVDRQVGGEAGEGQGGCAWIAVGGVCNTYKSFESCSFINVGWWSMCTTCGWQRVDERNGELYRRTTEESICLGTSPVLRGMRAGKRT